MRILGFLLLAGQVLLAESGISLVGAGYVNPVPVRVAPGQVTTFFLTGLQTVLPPPFRAERAPSLPLPYTLAGISATLRQSGPGVSYPVPMLSVDQLNTCTDPNADTANCMLTAVTLQIPFEMKPRNPLLMTAVDLIGNTEITFSENGAPSRSFALSPMMDAIHVLTNCGDARTDDNGALPCQALVAHADGNLVSAWGQPAEPGEELIIYAYGLGLTSTPVASGDRAPAGVLASPVRIDLDFRPNAGISRAPYGAPVKDQPTYVGLAAGLVGYYQINFRVPQPPAGTPACGSGIDSNLTVTIQGMQSYDGAKLCVDVQ